MINWQLQVTVIFRVSDKYKYFYIFNVPSSSKHLSFLFQPHVRIHHLPIPLLLIEKTNFIIRPSMVNMNRLAAEKAMIIIPFGLDKVCAESLLVSGLVFEEGLLREDG